MRLSPEAFWDLELMELNYAIAGYKREQENVVRAIWESSRMVGTTIYNVHAEKKLTEHRYRPLPWDQVEEDPLKTPEEVAQMANEMAKKFGVQQKATDPEKLARLQEKIKRDKEKNFKRK